MPEANGECDPAEECSGFSADCPADAFAPSEKPCEDGDPCTDADVCADGGCTSVRICAARRKSWGVRRGASRS